VTPADGPAPHDRGMSPALLQQLTLAILDHSADEGLRIIRILRSYLDTWEVFLQDRQQLRDHLLAVHQAGSLCMEADPASLNRQHWDAHGSDLTSFLAAHPVQGGRPRSSDAGGID
jgi:hypothetical protein